MKCNHCGSEWNVNPGLSVSMTNCPFCGQALLPEKKQLNTIEDVLQEISARFGMDTLKNGTKTIALFSDLSPNMKRERLLLSYLYQSSGHMKLLDVRTKAVEEQQICFRQVCRYMVEEQFVAEEAAQNICTSFSAAIGMKISAPPPKITAPAPAKPSPPKPPVKPASAPAPQINSYEKYLSALEAYYVRLGKTPLTDTQIHSFIYMNKLDRVWKITAADIKKDLAAIYAKHQSSTAAGKRIQTYEQYMTALENAYLKNGKVMLGIAEINAFLDAYNLRKTFNIHPSEVQQDLRKIAKKYT